MEPHTTGKRRMSQWQVQALNRGRIKWHFKGEIGRLRSMAIEGLIRWPVATVLIRALEWEEKRALERFDQENPPRCQTSTHGTGTSMEKTTMALAAAVSSFTASGSPQAEPSSSAQSAGKPGQEPSSLTFQGTAYGHIKYLHGNVESMPRAVQSDTAVQSQALVRLIK